MSASENELEEYKAVLFSMVALIIVVALVTMVTR